MNDRLSKKDHLVEGLNRKKRQRKGEFTLPDYPAPGSQDFRLILELNHWFS